MKIFVLGYTGMLGRYVYTYLKSEGYRNVIGLSRKELDASCISDAQLNPVSFPKGTIIINCMGVIKLRDSIGDLEFIQVNSVFPHLLANMCEKTGSKLVHVTTDCIYDGLNGKYDESFVSNAADIYGKTKALGEPKNATIIRTSIIGEELNNKRSLLEWVRSNKDKEVLGYTNHVWNGVTCLQFAKICKYIIDNKLFWRGVKHLYSPEVITKYELVKLISKVYDLDIKVIPHETETQCDRTLTSIRNDITIDIPRLETQINEMKLFYKVLKGDN